MIAHNRDHDHDVFQISPGTSRESMAAGLPGPRGQHDLERSVPAWNRRPGRRGCRPRPPQCRRRDHPRDRRRIPRLHGEIRPPGDPRSSLYNTDGQIFSDAGIPVVLFMENYDINRVGYHDTHDTMANIDLDYGAAVAAMAIESVARAQRRNLVHCGRRRPTSGRPHPATSHESRVS